MRQSTQDHCECIITQVDILFNNEERQKSSSGLVIRVQVGKLRIKGSIPGEDQALVSSQKYSEALNP